MKNKTYAGLIFILSLLLSLGFYIFRDFFQEASSLGLLGLFVVNFVSSATFFIPAPAFLTVIAGGNLYSPITVALIAATGACFGDMIGFLFGHSSRSLTREKLDRHKAIRFLEKHFHRHGALIIFILAIIPNPFFDAIGVLAGIVNYPPLKFFTIMFVGRFLRYLLLAQFGSRL